MTTLTPEDVHRRDAATIVDSIVRPTLEAGGEFNNVLALLEGVIVGVLLIGVKEGGDKMVIDMLFKYVRNRIAKSAGAERPKLIDWSNNREMNQKILFVLALTLLASEALAQSQTYYDPSGRSVGRPSTDSQGTTTFRDASGQVTGRSSTDSQGTTRRAGEALVEARRPVHDNRVSKRKKAPTRDLCVSETTQPAPPMWRWSGSPPKDF